MTTSKSNKVKLQFIEARAEGKSLRGISAELKISTSTCVEWDKQFSKEIDQAKADNLKEIYEAQALTRQARLESLGTHRAKILEALQEKDYKEIPADKLADMLLKVDKEVESTYSTLELPQVQPIEYKGIMTELTKLLQDANANKLSPAEIKARLELIKVYEEQDEKQADPFNLDFRSYDTEDTEPLREHYLDNQLHRLRVRAGIEEADTQEVDQEITPADLLSPADILKMTKQLKRDYKQLSKEEQEQMFNNIYSDAELKAFTLEAMPQDQREMVEGNEEYFKTLTPAQLIVASINFGEEEPNFTYTVTKFNDEVIYLPHEPKAFNYIMPILEEANARGEIHLPANFFEE